MPTATPPPPPKIQHSISLDERLGAVAEQVAVPGRPGHTVSASLAHVPSRVNVLFATGEDDVGVLELSFDYLDRIEEATKPGLVQEDQGRYAIHLDVGEDTGRIYHMRLEIRDFSDDSVDAITKGVCACFRDYVDHHKDTTLRQRAILQSMAVLVSGLLPHLIQRVRDSLQK